MEKQYYYGLKGLQEILNCGRDTAVRYKKSKRIPYSQIGRKLIFDRKEVIDALKVEHKNS